MMKPFHLRRFRLKYIVISLMITVWLLLNAIAIAGSQDMERPLIGLPYGQVGDVAYAPVRLDGRNLFSIATEREKEKNDQFGLESLQMRRNRIENRLNAQVQALVEDGIGPEALQVVTTRLNQQMAVQMVLNGKATKPIVTVTALDAEIYGLTEAEVAEEYARQIRQGVLQAVEERQPNAQRSQLQWAGIGGVIAALFIALLLRWQRQIARARRQLRQEFHNQQALLTQQQKTVRIDEETPQNDSESQQQLFDLKRQIDHKTWQKRILQLLQCVVGMTGLAWILQRFPQTRGLGVLLFRQPLGFLLIGLSVLIMIILSHFLIDRLLTKWTGTEDQFPLTQIQRRHRRILTLSPVLKNVTGILLIIVGLILACSLFSLSTGLSLFAEIGVVGLAVSLAFQSSIKDALTGWMLLAKDAFAVGDIVAVKDVTGVVEEMGLLMTQIRSSPGNLITFRNGEIASVSNLSKDWSRLDFTVLVDYSTDVQQAITTLREVFLSMQSDPDWGLQLISAPDILGVEQFGQDGILLKIRAQTPPGQQFGVTREFRLRLNQAFKDVGIKIPIPQREIRYRASGLE